MAEKKAETKPDNKGDQEELSFYDVKGKEKFKATKYEIVTKKGRRFAIADAPSGIKAWRIMGKA